MIASRLVEQMHWLNSFQTTIVADQDVTSLSAGIINPGTENCALFALISIKFMSFFYLHAFAYSLNELGADVKFEQERVTLKDLRDKIVKYRVEVVQ